ncbi:PepSY domain-containing protein [Geoalkalibacter halelectricus]|uniref:PepSY domain-containing protein n=1 Tax=Geoalkalibacter halelectricus TaxID=2847045 RepID=A0ABY5ZM89_9BACT|nr:PepSY domain-containing protein [Geoalkalibacter halelectricus]MDO3378905.1 PepSY domain-containing protein [Geoalkalibacter halelectricus]UWZ79072.1 PepSY domain-containing protein [Geoalkalibacter halelectricus]
MKKSRIVIAVLAVLLASGSAFAYGGARGGEGPGMGAGKGYTNPDCPRAESGRAGMGRKAAPEQEVTREQAQTKLQEHVRNFNGYTLGEMDSVERRHGTAYRAKVMDAGGNQFEFHVNPWGQVRGPFPVGQ